MRLFDGLPAPRVGRPRRHPCRRPVRIPHRLLRPIPPTVLERRRELGGQLGLLPLIEAIEARAALIAEEIRQRLRDLQRRLRAFGKWDHDWSVRS